MKRLKLEEWRLLQPQQYLSISLEWLELQSFVFSLRYYCLGCRLAQWVVQASHVQMLYPRCWFESQPGDHLLHVTPPVLSMKSKKKKTRKKDSIVYRINPYKTGPCVCKRPSTHRGSTEPSVLKWEYIYTSLMQHFEAGERTTQQSATVCHPLTHGGQYESEFSGDQHINMLILFIQWMRCEVCIFRESLNTSWQSNHTEIPIKRCWWSSPVECIQAWFTIQRYPHEPWTEDANVNNSTS